MSEVQKLVALLQLKDEFSGPARKISRTVGSLDKDISRTGTRALRAGEQIGTGIKNGVRIAASAIGFLATQVGFGLNQLVALEDITTQTNAAIKSTGGVAGVTAADVRKMSEEFENLNA